MGSFRPGNLLIYVTLAEFVLAGLAFLLKQRRLGWAQYALAFLMAITAVVVRGLHVGHVPMRNLYEVFLVLAALMFPLSLFGRFVLKAPGEMFDALLAAVLLVPPGFVFSADVQPLPPALQSPLFIPHVSAYVLAYVVLAKATMVGIVGMVRERKKGKSQISNFKSQISNFKSQISDFKFQISNFKLKESESPISYDNAVYRLVCLGFPFLTAGLLTGALWGKQAWGDWWNWDPKELWSLATWLIYVAYFHVRRMASKRRLRVEVAFVVTGLAFIVITLLWVNLSRLFPGLHTYAT
ncbi:MAG: cytochrome c biogenesis protein CcsA [Phycisphaerae bacterium]|nr:cytochrome c biogenesis protein CcsA [Phycisphaerae bacterium]